MINTQRLNDVERSDTYFKSKGDPLRGAHGSEDDRTSGGGAGATGDTERRPTNGRGRTGAHVVLRESGAGGWDFYPRTRSEHSGADREQTDQREGANGCDRIV